MTQLGRAEERWLTRAFASLLATVAPLGLAYGCGGSASSGGSITISGAGGGALQPTPTTDAHDDAHDDARDGGDADARIDAGDASDTSDASDASCATTYADWDAGPASPGACMFYFPCGIPQGITSEGCVLLVENVPFGCFLAPDSGCGETGYVPPDGASLIAECPTCPNGGAGRRTGRRRRARSATPHLEPLPQATGAYVAAMAREERAAVDAFERLARELEDHGAPSSLVSSALSAANDERRHAGVLSRLARRLGNTSDASEARPRRWPRRSLEAVARENAVEGAVREAFGALLLTYQARRAPRLDLARAFGALARDEVRHAALAFRVASWAEGELAAPSRRRIRRATTHALAKLPHEALAPPMARLVGAPSPAVHRSLALGFARAVHGVA